MSSVTSPRSMRTCAVCDVPDDRYLHPDFLAGIDHVIEERVDSGVKMLFTHVNDSDGLRPSNSSVDRTAHRGDRPDAVHRCAMSLVARNRPTDPECPQAALDVQQEE